MTFVWLQRVKPKPSKTISNSRLGLTKGGEQDMAKVERYKASREFKLDCGHSVAVGQTFVVTKTFTCEQDANRTVHDTLETIRHTLENGVKHLKWLEWDLRHKK